MQCKYCPGTLRVTTETAYEARYICRACKRVEIVPKPQPARIPRSKSYICYNHQNKADALIQALAPSWTLSSDGSQARFILADNDAPGRHSMIGRAMKRTGARVLFVYPHAARPSLINDIHPAWDLTTAQFVVSDHHQEVLRLLGNEKPLHSIGWHLCPIQPFKSILARPGPVFPLQVLFAPIHPVSAPVDKWVNGQVFDRLYPLVLSGQIDLTVRYIGTLADNGLQWMSRVTYFHGLQDLSLWEIDRADLVVGHQTFAWLAVARGIPTLMAGESVPAHDRVRRDVYLDLKSWDRVSPLFKYPLDILQESDTLALMSRCIKSDAEISDWRDRMIGPQFDPQNFVRIVEGYL